jgi:hypothetical protein
MQLGYPRPLTRRRGGLGGGATRWSSARAGHELRGLHSLLSMASRTSEPILIPIFESLTLWRLIIYCSTLVAVELALNSHVGIPRLISCKQSRIFLQSEASRSLITIPLYILCRQTRNFLQPGSGPHHGDKKAGHVEIRLLQWISWIVPLISHATQQGAQGKGSLGSDRGAH